MLRSNHYTKRVKAKQNNIHNVLEFCYVSQKICKSWNIDKILKQLMMQIVVITVWRCRNLPLQQYTSVPLTFAVVKPIRGTQKIPSSRSSVGHCLENNSHATIFMFFWNKYHTLTSLIAWGLSFFFQSWMDLIYV